MKQISLAITTVLLFASGCTDKSAEPSAGGNVPVAVMGVAGLERGAVQMMKSNGTTGTVDSIRVASTIIVLKDIAFRSHIDTVAVEDSTQTECRDRDEDKGIYRGSTEHFRGPFIVELLNNTPTQIALDTIPPGTYDGIKFVLHKLHRRDAAANPLFPDSLVGYSVLVSGKVYSSGDSTGAPFVFKADINEEFKVRGDFTVEAGSNLVPYALDFQMDNWFNGRTRILDPNNFWDRHWIRWNIKHAFKNLMRGGRDRNHDGHPDD